MHNPVPTSRPTWLWLCVVLVACGTDPETVKCQLAVGDPRIESVETKCDGVDNDCDGVVDRLMPVEANRCAAAGKGACANGFAACVGGERACLAPPPVAETVNGIDDDCNGLADDVTFTAVPLRARVLLPPYLWAEAPRLSDAFVENLEHVGIPNTSVPPAATDKPFDWNAGFYELDQHALVLVPGYLEAAIVTPAQLQKLHDFVEKGGVLVWTKLIGPEPGADPVDAAPIQAVLALGGLKQSQKHMDGTRLRITADVPAALYLDAPEERDVVLSHDIQTSPLEVFTYQLDPASGAHAFGRVFNGDQDLGPVMVRRPLGKGAVYTIGIDLLDYLPTRCYLNCFDPGFDVLAMMLRGIYREATGGHYAVKHTVPGLQSSVLALTHDVDAPDADNDDPEWGSAGAAQMANMEKSLGVKGSYMITTDYVHGYFTPTIVTRLCALGMCPQGGHSVQHYSFNPMPLGDCGVTKATYDPKKPTVCGEVVVNLKWLSELLPADQPIRAWRSPYLSQHPELFNVLNAQGIVYDSSFATGDLRTNFPVSMARYPYLPELFQNQPMYTFPIQDEDGNGGWNADGSTSRKELQTTTWPLFRGNWVYALLRHLGNHSWNVLLVHPSYGLGVGPANLKVKIAAVREFVKIAQKQDVLIEQIDALGDFWRGRDGVQLIANLDPQLGYVGTLQAGKFPAPHFSLEFGDNITKFTCEGGGPTTIRGGRVLFRDPLPAGAKLAFTAHVQ